MKAIRTESNEGPRAKSDCPRSGSYHHASERLGVCELLHVLVAFALAFACSPERKPKTALVSLLSVVKLWPHGDR